MQKLKHIVARFTDWLKSRHTPHITLERREPVPVRVQVHGDRPRR
jgi:desulfoferrodoxin (superoxide reductase-like protein)